MKKTLMDKLETYLDVSMLQHTLCHGSDHKETGRTLRRWKFKDYDISYGRTMVKIWLTSEHHFCTTMKKLYDDKYQRIEGIIEAIKKYPYKYVSVQHTDNGSIIIEIERNRYTETNFPNPKFYDNI